MSSITFPHFLRAACAPRVGLTLALALVPLLIAARPVAAQVCGDASGDGTVTVTDGVQTLRAAAQLSSSCSLASCDVDGSGSITVTDGVNVLRKAAQLSAPNACSGGGGDQAEVSSVTEAIAPLLIFGFNAISDVSLPAASDVQTAGGMQIDVDDCPVSGVRRKRLLGSSIINVEFDACRYSAPTLGTFELEDTISVNFFQKQVALNFTVTDVDSGRVVTFRDFVDFQPVGDGFQANGGPVNITILEGGVEKHLQVTFQQLVFDDEGRPTSGAATVTDPDDAFELQTVTFTVTSAATASVVATFDDGHQAPFVLNLITGAFTPA